MADGYLQAFGIPVERATAAADFHEAFATYRLSDADGDVPETVRLPDAASALRVAGQWAMLFDQSRGRRLLVQSARIWHDLGHGFGSFLLEALAPGQLSPRDMAVRMDYLLSLHQPNGNQPAGADRRTFGPLRYPQQQAYLAVAIAGMADRIDVDPRLFEVSSAPAHLLGVAPVGSMGTPARVYWDIARSLLQDDGRGSARVVVRHVTRMAAAFDERVRLAVANERLWANAAAPVDVTDLDLVGITRTAANRVGPDVLNDEMRRVEVELPVYGQQAFDLAVRLVDEWPGDHGDRDDYG